MARIREEVTTAVGEVRRILDDLRPAVLDSTRLLDAIRRHAAALSTGPSRSRWTPPPTFPPCPRPSRRPPTASPRKALANVVRHAGAPPRPHHA
jgi:two-component system NarL family sensor kinase